MKVPLGQQNQVLTVCEGALLYTSTGKCPGLITALNCGASTTTGVLTAGFDASGVSISVPYSGGNSGIYSAQTASSTGVTGLTATLSAGTLANGSGNLTFTITGTPATAGTASFALNIGGASCNLEVSINSFCFAKISASETKIFMCHNLGAANTAADPFTPSWEINGGYWQWGRLTMAAPGPTGPGPKESNEGVVAGWNTTNAGYNAWSDASKTPNDPCPSGFRIPTRAQWIAVRSNNIATNVGTWTNLSTNYSSGKRLGSGLMLPACGLRTGINGAMYYRGNSGYYWSSTQDSSDLAWNLYFHSGSVDTDISDRPCGRSVRCIAE